MFSIAQQVLINHKIWGYQLRLMIGIKREDSFYTGANVWGQNF